MIDEMSIKRFLSYDRLCDTVIGYDDCGFERKNLEATNALVFMIRGLAANYKQPIGYVFSHSCCSGELLLTLLYRALDILGEIGLKVKAIISDQGSNFVKLTTDLGVSATCPTFTHKSKTYHYIFDVPHLLKSVRNNLFKYHISFEDNKTAQWRDIVKFYDVKKKRFRLAPKLTQKHIQLPAFSKMKVKLAAQVLSRTVAAALETHVQTDGSSGSETAEFLMKFDQLFDCMNSSHLKDPNRFKRPLSSTSGHITFLRDCIDWLDTIRVKDSSGKDMTNLVKCFDGWKMSISSLIHLWKDLEQYEFKFLYTRRLNQDALKKLFSVMRLKGGSCDNPTPIDFARMFKQVSSRQLLPASVGSNCELDVADVLATIATPLPDKTRVRVGRERMGTPFPFFFKMHKMHESSI